jgi:serine/threonine-protein kinase PpkA
MTNSTTGLTVFGALALLVAPVAHAQTDGDALKTKHGTPLKVIVRAPAATYERPDPASPSRPANQFDFFYVLPTANGGQEKVQNGFYRVASAPRYVAQVGWVQQDAVVEWPHAQVLGLRPKAGRDAVLFFADPGAVEGWYRGSGVKPISREPAQLQGAQLFPLLDVGQFEHKGDKVEVYKVAYLHRQAGPTSAASAAASVTAPSGGPNEKSAGPVTRAELERDFVLQVCFVLDTTASMQPFIDAAKKVIAAVADDLARDPSLRGRVEFALVCYRDQLATEEANRRMEYVAKVVCDFKAGADHAEFQRRLAPVREADVGSEDTPEDVLAGLKKAVQEAGWKRTAYKHLVLIGDASAQVDANSHKNVERLTIPGLLALAQPTGPDVWAKIQLHGLRILGADPDDHRRCKEHFEQLTAGREFAGLHFEYAGPQDAPKFVEQVTARLRQMAGYAQKVAGGKAQELVQEAKQAAPGSEQRRLLGPILEMLQATDERAGGGTSPTFAEGYAAVLDREGNRALEAHVLVTHGRLALFASALDFAVNALEGAGDPGNRDVQKVVGSLQILATQVNLGESVTPDLPLAKLLSMVLGFPVRNPIFAKTPAQLAAMSGADYQKWVQQIRASETVVKSHLENGSIWFHLGPKAGRPQDRHSFLKVSDLP